jgi:Tol biopolymer transport system component
MDLYGRNAANAATNIWTGYVPGNNLCCTNLTSSTASGTDSFNPVWSPDGTLIFFDSSRSLNANDLVNTNTRNIWVVAADGGGDRAVTQITAVDAGSSKPVFSRDGSKIVFESTRALDPGSDAANTNRTRNIWMINADGSGAMPLTNATAAGADSFGPRLP